MESTASNPLANLANSIPAATLRGASLAARLFGAGIAIAVAFDQSYDPTQVFTVVVAAVILATLVPVERSIGDVLAGFGAGVVFFAGTVLTHLGLGLGLLAMGAVAGLAAFALAHRAGRDATLPAVAFIAGVFFVGALQALVVFSFE